jgi:hypothetical protein
VTYKAANSTNLTVPTLYSALLQMKTAKEPLPDKGDQQSIDDRTSNIPRNTVL